MKNQEANISEKEMGKTLRKHCATCMLPRNEDVGCIHVYVGGWGEAWMWRQTMHKLTENYAVIVR